MISLAPMAGAAIAQWVGIPPVLFMESFFLLLCALLAYRLGWAQGMRPLPGLPRRAGRS